MERAHRLTSSRDLQRVLRRGTRASRASVTCVVDRTGREGPGRVAVSASRRIGSAVERNRARRRLREAVRARIDAVPEGSDVVVIARRPVDGRDFQKLVEDVASAMSEAAALTEAARA